MLYCGGNPCDLDCYVETILNSAVGSAASSPHKPALAAAIRNFEYSNFLEFECCKMWFGRIQGIRKCAFMLQKVVHCSEHGTAAFDVEKFRTAIYIFNIAHREHTASKNPNAVQCKSWFSSSICLYY
jgi:hypothetical protein